MKFNSNEEWAGKGSDDDTDYELLEEYLNICLSHLTKFNGWEEEFINDMIKRVEARGRISVKQKDIVNSLYEKATFKRRF